MRRGPVVLIAVLTLAAGLLAAPAVAAAGPVAPYTVLGLAASVRNGPGGASTTSDLVATATPTGVAVDTPGAVPRMQVSLAPPTGDTFRAGEVYPVGPTASATTATASLRRAPQQCSPVASGSITVREATVGADGKLSAFAADLDLACGALRFVGPLRLSSSVGYEGVTLTPFLAAFGSLTVGQTRDVPVTLTATGTDALPSITAATFTGSDPEDFAVVADTCAGGPLPAGQSCTVTVRARPVARGALSATLVIPHEGSTPYEVRLEATAYDTADGTYSPGGNDRVLDTRTGVGHAGPLGPGEVAHVDLAPYLQVPVSSVVVNLTVDRPTAAGYLTAYASGTARPTVSSINFAAGWQGANLVTVPVGAGNSIDIYNALGSTPVIADIVGVYLAGDGPRGGSGGYQPVQVQRLLDTRTWGLGRLGANRSALVFAKYAGQTRGIAALSVTITAVKPANPGYLTTWNGSSIIPRTSTLNFTQASTVVSNAAIVPVAYYDSRCLACAAIGILNQSAGPVDVVVDVNGYFGNGSQDADVRYHPLDAPTRIVDTRRGQGTTTFGTGTTRTVTTPAGVAGNDTVALDANVTAVTPTAATYLTVWPTVAGTSRPLASLLNPDRGQTLANHAIAGVGAGRFNVFNYAGRTDLVVDVAGTFDVYPATSDGSAAARVLANAPANIAGKPPVLRGD